MADFFGSDSFFLHLLDLRASSREEMAIALMPMVEKACWRIQRDPGLGFSRATKMDMEDYISAAIIRVLEEIDSFLDNERNYPDPEAEDHFSPFERQSWLRFRVLSAMKTERGRLYYHPSIHAVSIDAPVSAHDKDESTVNFTPASPDPGPEYGMEAVSEIAGRLRAIVESPCQTDTVLCVLYSIFATTADQKCTYDDCEVRLKGQDRLKICQMILDTFCMLGLSASVESYVYDELLSMLHDRLARENPNVTVEHITSDKIRKSKNRMFSLIDRIKGDQ